MEMNKLVYLDSASTTPIDEEVLNEMMPYMTSLYGNPNSLHSLGRESRKAIEQARERVANLINANPENIIFTSGGSEANNLAVKSIGGMYYGTVTSKYEHDSMLAAIANKVVNDEFPVFPTFLTYRTASDLIKSAEVYCQSHDRFRMSFMYTNNELGFNNPIKEISKIFHRYSSLDSVFITDCVQALGFENIDVKDIGCDMLTMSSHKIHGPKGVGALYIWDKDMIMNPLINGGISQEFGKRGGTENVAGIVGFGKACELANKNLKENRERILYIRKLFLEHLDGIDYKLNCDEDSKILSIQFPGVDSETMVYMLSADGIAVSSGSACRNLEMQDNKTLIAYGLTSEEAKSTVRFSFIRDNTEEEVIYAANKVKENVNMVKGGMAL